MDIEVIIMAKPDDASKKDEEKKEEESKDYGTTKFSTTKSVDTTEADKKDVLPEFRHAEEWERNLLGGNYNPHKQAPKRPDVRDIFPKTGPETENKPQAKRAYAIYKENSREAPKYKVYQEQNPETPNLGKEEIHKQKHDIKKKIENNLSRDSLDQLSSSMLHTQSPEEASRLMSNHIVAVLKDCQAYYELDNSKQSKRSIEKINSLIQDVEKNKEGYMTNSRVPITSLLNQFHSIAKDEKKSGMSRLFGSRDLLSTNLHKLDKKLPDVYDIYIASTTQMKPKK